MSVNGVLSGLLVLLGRACTVAFTCLFDCTSSVFSVDIIKSSSLLSPNESLADNED